MADRYFDRNSTTTGFGTLTGVWNTALAYWSTSATGNVALAAYTFTNADAALFGSASASATAGTATIADALQINLNKLQFANLAAQQTIAATGSGNLRFSGTNPSIVNLGNAQHIISAPINFPSGLRVQPGSPGLQLRGAGQASNSGTVTVTEGTLYCLITGSGTPDQLKGATEIAINQTSLFTSLQYYGSTAYTEPASLSITAANLGSAGIFSHNNGGVTLTHPSVSTFAGSFGALAYLTSTLTGELIFNNPPEAANTLFLQSSGLGTGQTGIAPVMVFNHNSVSTIPAQILLYTGQASTSAAGVNLVLEQNSPSLTTFSGSVTSQSGSNATAYAWLHLGGTGTSALTGNYTATAGTNGLRKTGSGTWTVSGTNTFTGSVLIEAGTLHASSNEALGVGAGAASVISGTGVLSLGSGVSLFKGSTDFSLTNTSSPIQVPSGTARFNCKNLALASSQTTTFNIESGSTLEIYPLLGGVISGANAALTKSGLGTLAILGLAGNTFNGSLTISQGTLLVNSLNNSGVAGPLGMSTLGINLYGTLKFSDTVSASTNRTIYLFGSNSTLEAAGTAAVTYSDVASSGASTLYLTGTSTANNTISSALSWIWGGFGFTKQGGGLWRLTGALSVNGPNTVSEGTLRVETADSNTITSTTTVSSGAILELVTDSLAESTSGAGTVLGSGAVVVNGTVRTRGGTVQKGQVRYGGDLTFNANSVLRVGAAA